MQPKYQQTKKIIYTIHAHKNNILDETQTFS
jgi:hypothetical protein